MGATTVSAEKWLSLCKARRNVLTLWALLKNVPRLSEIIVVDSIGSLAERLAQENGIACSRVPSATLLEHYGIWLEPCLIQNKAKLDLPAVNLHPIRLGARAGWREYVLPVQPAQPFGVPESIRIRQETLSTVLHGRKSVGLVRINDPMYLSDILESGKEQIQRLQPIFVVTLPSEETSSLNAQFAWMRRLGYVFYDMAFEPCGDEFADVERECIAIPEAAIHVAKICYDWLRLQATNALTAECVFDRQWLPDWIEAGKEVMRTVIETNGLPQALEMLPAENWHQTEGSGLEKWRWSGNEPDGRIVIPLFAPGDYTLKIRLTNYAKPDLVGKAQVFINGRLQIGVGEKLKPGALVEMPFAVDVGDWNGTIELRISLPNTARPNPDDPRSLGVSIDLVELKWSTPRWN